MSKSEIKNRKMLLSQKNYEVYNFSIRKIEWLAVILRSYRYFYIHSKINALIIFVLLLYLHGN